LQVSDKDSAFLLQNKAAAMIANLFLADGGVIFRQPPYAPDLADEEYFFYIL
jgi:hypothetical protein